MSVHHTSLNSWAEHRLHSLPEWAIRDIIKAAKTVAKTTPHSKLKQNALRDEYAAVIMHPNFMDMNGKVHKAEFSVPSGEERVLMNVVKVYKGYCDAQNALKAAMDRWSKLGRKERELVRLSRGAESEDSLKAAVRTWEDLVMSVERQIDLWCDAQAEKLFRYLERKYYDIPTPAVCAYVADVKRWNYVSLVVFPEMVVGVQKNHLT